MSPWRLRTLNEMTTTTTPSLPTCTGFGFIGLNVDFTGVVSTYLHRGVSSHVSVATPRPRPWRRQRRWAQRPKPHPSPPPHLGMMIRHPCLHLCLFLQFLQWADRQNYWNCRTTNHFNCKKPAFALAFYFPALGFHFFQSHSFVWWIIKWTYFMHHYWCENVEIKLCTLHAHGIQLVQ